VKVDVLGRDRTDVLASVAPIAGRPGIRLLAERVETRDAYSMWADAGFELFQGYFHRRPELVQRRDLRPEQLQVIEAMNLIQDAATSDQQVAGHIRRNPTLAYKVVRMANVAMLGGRRIESVQHAIALVGRGALLRWLALMLAASWGRENGTSRALLREALLRARMCELLAEGTERPSGHLFLIGLFSRIDALLGVPMEELLRHVALPDPATAALLRRAGPYAPVLTLVEAWEEGRWSDVDCRAPEAPCVRLPAAWGEAVGWADAVSREI
jgi:EAL and modified HD-GYP domain-containing signal transduction protein